MHVCILVLEVFLYTKIIDTDELKRNVKFRIIRTSDLKLFHEQVACLINLKLEDELLQFVC